MIRKSAGKLFIGLTLLTTAASIAHADSDDYLSQTSMGTAREKILRKLAEEMSPAFKTFSRDIYVYHWGGCRYQAQGDVGDMKANDSFALENTQRLILWTYRKDKDQGGAMGTSYYASTDPVHTRNYGDCLTETKIPAKARFLDERLPIYFSQELRTMMQSEKCYFGGSLTQLLGNNNSDPCHEIATELFLMLGISAVVYPYGASTNACAKSEHRAAFILVNPSLAQPKYSQAFSPSHVPVDQANPSRKRIKGVYEMMDSYRRSDVWPELEKPSDDITKAWINKHIFGCDPDNYPEDKYVDPDVKNKLPELNFNAKVPSWGVLPPIGDEGTDCCKAANSDLQEGVIRTINSLDPAMQALLNGP